MQIEGGGCGKREIGGFFSQEDKLVHRLINEIAQEVLLGKPTASRRFVKRRMSIDDQTRFFAVFERL